MAQKYTKNIKNGKTKICTESVETYSACSNFALHEVFILLNRRFINDYMNWKSMRFQNCAFISKIRSLKIHKNNLVLADNRQFCTILMCYDFFE